MSSAAKQREYRIRRLYGLSVQEYEAAKGGAGTCHLCSRPAKIGAFRWGKAITGFLCYGCRSLVRALHRFPGSASSLLKPEALARLSRLFPVHEAAAGVEQDSTPLRGSSETMIVADYKHSSETVILEPAWLKARIVDMEAAEYPDRMAIARFKTALRAAERAVQRPVKG